MTQPGISNRNAAIVRRRASRGHAAIEAAFIFIPMFAMVFGIIDIGLMIFRWSTLQNAVREGVRYAITFQTQGASGQTASITNVVERNAFGFVTAADMPQHIFVAYLNPDLTVGQNTPGNVVEVTVKNITFSWLAPLSGTIYGGASSVNNLYATTPLGLKVVAADILGGYPAGVNGVNP